MTATTRPVRLAISNGFLVEANEDGSIPLSARYYAEELRDSAVSLELCRRWNAQPEFVSFVERWKDRMTNERTPVKLATLREFVAEADELLARSRS